MSRKAFCSNCGIELVGDVEQRRGYCYICLDKMDKDEPEPYDCDMDIERQKLEELEHPDEKGREGKTIAD